MGPIPRNILANILGQGWAVAMSLLLVPVYIRLLGVEAFGLIGVYATLQASLKILDLGLSQMMSRQMAHYGAIPDRADKARDLVRTVEVGYWAIGVVMGAAIVAAAPLLARRWLNVAGLPIELVENAIRIMGVVTALQWPQSLYDGGLSGLQRQVLLNKLKVAMATFGAAGTVVVLWISPRITSYFAWQVIASSATVAALAFALWRSLPGAGRAAFRPRLVPMHWRLAAGMGGIAVTGVLLTQLDKLVLSKLLSLEAFGYYALAGVVSSVIPVLVAGPVFSAVFPQLTASVATGADVEVERLYHRGTQLMAVLVSATAGVIALFPFEIVLAWTRSEQTAAHAAPIISVLIIGMAANALMTLPYALQLAHGWTSLGLRINLVLLVLLVPAIIALTNAWGPVGAAGAWVLLNALYMLVGVPLTHRKLLRGHARAWVARDIVPPLAAALAVLGAGRMIVARGGSSVWTVLSVALAFLMAVAAATLAAPLVRRALQDWLGDRWSFEHR